MASSHAEVAERPRNGTTATLTTFGPGAVTTGVRPAVVIQAMLLMLVIANLGRIPVLSTGERQAPILVNDLCVACMIGMAVLAGVRARSFRIDLAALVTLAFALIGGGSAILAVPRFGIAPMELVLSLAYLARWLFYAAVYLVIINTVRRGEAEGVWAAAETMLLVFAGFGIVQAAFLPGFAQLIYPESRAYLDWDLQGHRLVSTVLDPNIASAMLLIGFLVALARLSAGAPVARWKLLVFFAALVLTLSRSAALGLFAGGMVILVARGLSKRMLRLMGGIAVLLLASTPVLLKFAAGYGKLGFDASAAARLVSWLRAYQALRDHPVIGVGFNTFGYVLDRAYGVERFGAASYSSDGGLLFIAAMTGLLGLAVYVGLLWVVVKRCRWIWNDHGRPASERGFAIGVAATVVAICVHSLFVNSLLTPFVMELLWVQWALVFVLVSDRARPGSDRRLVPR